MSNEEELCKKLNLISGWPMYIVVTPGHYGIYDSLNEAINDCKGAGIMKHVMKYKATDCMNSIIGYYNYHFPNDKIKSVTIPAKNMMFKVHHF